MNCTKCGASLLETASFCTACGTPVTKEPPKSMSTAQFQKTMFDFYAQQCLIYGHKAQTGVVTSSEMGYGASLVEDVLHTYLTNDIHADLPDLLRQIYVYHITRKLYNHLLNRWYDANQEKKTDLLWSDLEKYCKDGLTGLFADETKGSVSLHLIDSQSIPYVEKFPGIVAFLKETVIFNLVFYLVACEHQDYQADYDRLSQLLTQETVDATVKDLVDAGHLKFKDE
jgi:hypothetical protein